MCGLTATGTNNLANKSAIFEVTKTTPPQTVWQMLIAGQYAYRAFRMPSLYPASSGKANPIAISFSAAR